MREPLARWLGAALVLASVCTPASAKDTIRIAAQKTGTLAWELAIIRAHKFDDDIKLVVTELASPEAGKIALRGGSADIIVADWLWVSRERHLGAKLTFYPFSNAIGAVMVPGDSPIKTLADLKGRSLAVAGGPLDKNWLLLQGAMRKEGLDLKSESKVVYGAPALLAEKALRGEFDAVLNFWNFGARLEAKGFRRIADIEELLPRLGARGRVPMLGYVFHEEWAAKNKQALESFLAAAAMAKAGLANNEDEWKRIAPLMGNPDPETLKFYRQRYREAVAARSIREQEEDARILYGVLAELGGEELVGPGRALAPGTFYRAAFGN
jgi:NitT/TauT family transport system substrate-binding protein